MLDINLEINKLLYDKNYQIRALEAFNRGDFFDVFNNEQYKNEVLEHASYKDLCEKWVSAKDLKKGDKVLLSDGKYCIIIGKDRRT